MEEKTCFTTEIKTSDMIPADADAMRFLYELGTQNRDFKIVEIDGRTFVNTESGSLDEILPQDEAIPTCFKAFTLSGLVRWLHEDVENMFEKFGRLYVQVEGTRRVSICTPGTGRKAERKLLAYSSAEIPDIRFDQYLDQESFLIHLQTRFADVKDFAIVAELAGNVRTENEAQTADDGMSQRVTIRDGVSAVKEAIIRNPFMLAPKRTFEEIEQPTSPFVLRIRKNGEGPQIALFEADGGVWKNEAVRRIGAWLEEQLSDLPVVVIA